MLVQERDGGTYEGQEQLRVFKLFKRKYVYSPSQQTFKPLDAMPAHLPRQILSVLDELRPISTAGNPDFVQSFLSSACPHVFILFLQLINSCQAVLPYSSACLSLESSACLSLIGMQTGADRHVTLSVPSPSSSYSGGIQHKLRVGCDTCFQGLL